MKLGTERKRRISVPCGCHISIWRPKFIISWTDVLDGTLLTVPRRSKGTVIVEISVSDLNSIIILYNVFINKLLTA